MNLKFRLSLLVVALLHPNPAVWLREVIDQGEAIARLNADRERFAEILSRQ